MNNVIVVLDAIQMKPLNDTGTCEELGDACCNMEFVSLSVRCSIAITSALDVCRRGLDSRNCDEYDFTCTEGDPCAKPQQQKHNSAE